jgi:hypothetical protein
MLTKIAVAGLATGGLMLAALTAPSAIAARVGGIGAPGISVPHLAPGGAPHMSPGSAHTPRGAYNHPGPGARVYGGNYGRVHHRRGYGVIIGGGYDGDYYGDYYGYADDCEWLHARAVSTGSRYWWRRYEDCVEG